MFLQWTIHEKTNNVNEVINAFKKCKPDYAALDTETNGLHLIRSKPFLLSFSFGNFSTLEAHAFVFDPNEEIIATIYAAAKRTKKLVFWNAKFDLHMMTNLGYPYPYQNITDAMIYVRCAHDNLTPTEGGVVLKLKEYATKFIDPNAKIYLKAIKEEQTIIKRAINIALKKALPHIDVEEYEKDILSQTEEIDNQIQTIRNQFPNPNDYSQLPRAKVEKYAAYDAVYTLEAFYQCYPIAIKRKQEAVIDREERLILPVYYMERNGFKIDKDYLLMIKDKLKTYILQKQKEMFEIVGYSFKIGQHALIKKIFKDLYGLLLESSNAEALSKINNPLSNLITELRSLIKWYSTYCVGWLEKLDENNKVYAELNQVGAVSGRFSSDFQQFPKEPMLDSNGNELFHPRKMFITDNKLLLMDYSQMELRIQAVYTILIMGGDLNLCRIYMPFRCYNSKTLKSFEFKDTPSFKTQMLTEWLHFEDQKVWKGADLHTLTTKVAFPDVTPGSKEFEHYRKISKSANFAITYGASINRLMSPPLSFNREMANKLYNAYYKAFPGVMKYRKYVESYLATHNNIPNLYGRRFYGINAHKARNYLIQGSGADMMKEVIIEIHKYLTSNNLKTKMLLTVHDELIFDLDPNEEHIIPALQYIMEDFNLPVPILTEIEISSTNWADKKKYANPSN